MKRLVQRTKMAERMVAGRQKRDAKVQRGKDKADRLRQESDAHRELTQNLRDARKARRDAWALGPLAPKRDLGTNSYAVMGSGHRQQPSLPLRPKELAARCAWAGEPKYLNLVVGDRVVVLEGPDRGRIDVVRTIHMDTATIELKETNQTRIPVPDYMAQDTDVKFPTMAMSYRLPISAVRLVHPLRDPATGVVRDVIINQLARSKVRWDRHTGYRTWRRLVPGLNVTIPWPPRPIPDRADTAADTPREHVVAQTFVPTLLAPPMPPSLIDELRGRFSRFRTRHEPLYVARKEREDELRRAGGAARPAAETMSTPVQEFNRQRRAERRAAGQPALTEEMLERIGEVIARNKVAALAAAGAEEVTSVLDDIAPPESALEEQPRP